MSDFERLSIIYDSEFEEQLSALISDYFEADEFVRGAEDLLSRLPQSGTRLTDSVWSLPMCPVSNRQVTLFYAIGETAVIFLAILAED